MTILMSPGNIAVLVNETVNGQILLESLANAANGSF